jgi:hypothetical protein
MRTSPASPALDGTSVAYSSAVHSSQGTMSAAHSSLGTMSAVHSSQGRHFAVAAYPAGLQTGEVSNLVQHTQGCSISSLPFPQLVQRDILAG